MSDFKQSVSISDKMARLIYVERQLISGLAFFVLGLSGLIGCFFLYHLMANNFDYDLNNPRYFDSYSPTGCSTTDVQYMTDYFAEHIKEKYLLYFCFDATAKPFILCAEGELPDNLQAIMDYTYGDEPDPIPDPVRVYGFCRPLTSEIMGFARDSYSTMWDENEQLPISSDDLYTMVGNYYLDIRPSSFRKEYPWVKWIFLFPTLFLVTGITGLKRYRKKLKACHQRMEEFSGRIAQADSELSRTEPFKKGLPLYLTDHYLITAVYYFNIIPLEQITELLKSSSMLTAVTEDGSRHMIIEKSRCRKDYERLTSELEGKIKAARYEAGMTDFFGSSE